MKFRRIVLGFLVSAVFLFFALRNQDFEAIRDAFSQINYWFLVPAIILYFIGLLFRAYRWSVLLRPVAHVHTRDLVHINAVGLMANNILPLRTGEFVRSYALSKRTDIRKSTALATIAVERIFDGLTMLIFIASSMLFVTLTSELEHVAELAFLLFAIALLAIVLLAHGGRARDRMLKLALGPLPDGLGQRVHRMADSFVSGLGIFKRRRELVLVSAASLVAWGFEVSVYWMTAQAFGDPLADAMGVPEALLTTGIANLATLIPSSPGYVGPFEAAVILVVHGALDLSRELALSYAILVHALLYFPVTIWGAIEWSRLHLSLRQVEEAEAEAAVEVNPALQEWVEPRPAVRANPNFSAE